MLNTTCAMQSEHGRKGYAMTDNAPDDGWIVRELLSLADDLRAMGLIDSATALTWLSGAVARELGVTIDG